MKKLRIYYNGKVHEMCVEEIDNETVVAPLDRAKSEKNAPVDETPKVVQPPSLNFQGEDVESPMPGRIVKIEVNVGQAVQSGDTLMLVEAMKLENEISCETTGVVKEIRVNVGQMVNSGDIVAVIG